MESLKERIQHIIQLHMKNIDGQQRVCSLLINQNQSQFFKKLIQIAQETTKTITHEQINSNYGNQDFYTKKMLAISQIINRQIALIVQQEKFQSYQQILKEFWNFLAKLSDNEYQIIQNYIQHTWSSLELLLQNCNDHYVIQIVQTFQQNFQDKQKIEAIFYKVFINSVQNIKIVEKIGLKMIVGFSDRFFSALQMLVNKLAYVQTEKEGVHLVSQRVQKWSIFLELLTQLLQRLYQYEESFQNILQELERKQIHKMIKQVLKIDQILQIKPPIQEEQSGELLGLGLLVSCKYVEFNQNINILKTNALSVINFFLRNTDDQECEYFSNIIEILTRNLYEQMVGDLCIISRQYLHFKSVNYLYSGQYSLVKSSYEFLCLSVSIPFLKDRLLSAINETIGWQNFLLFLCLINIKQFSYQILQENQKSNEKKLICLNETPKHKNKQLFATQLLTNIIQHKQKWREQLISFCNQIIFYLIQQSNKKLRKILENFGIKAEPFLQEFLQNPKNLSFWLHIINLLTMQRTQISNIQLLKLLKIVSNQLIYFQTQGLKQFLNLYLNFSHKLMVDQIGNQIIQKVLETVFHLIQNSDIQDKRASVLLVFLTKFVVQNGCFSLNQKVQNLFNFCFRKIEKDLYRIQSGSNRYNLEKQSKELKIYLNFMTKFLQAFYTQKYTKQDGMKAFQRIQQILTQIIRSLLNNWLKLSQKQRQLVCKLVNGILRNISNIIDYSQNEKSKISIKINKLIDSIVDLILRIKQVHKAYFSSIKLLLSLSKQYSYYHQSLANHILQFVKKIFKKDQLSKYISSTQLKSIIQILLILQVQKNYYYFSHKFWQDVCILAIKQSKNKFSSQQDIKKQQRLSQSPRKLIVKNRLRLQIQAFKLTILLLSTHSRIIYKQQQISDKLSCSDKDLFLQSLHETISLSNQLNSFEKFLKFEDLSMITFAVDDYIKFLSFEERRGFLVQMMMLFSETKVQKSNKKGHTNFNYLPSNFNPVFVIRSHSFDLLFEIEGLLKDQTIEYRKREQNQRYHYAIRILLKKLQSLTVVESEKRQIYKVKQNKQEGSNKQNEELII